METWMIVAGIAVGVVVTWYLSTFFDVVGSTRDYARSRDTGRAALADAADDGRPAVLHRSAARGLAIRSRGASRGIGELQLHANALVIALPTGSLRVPRADIVGAARTRQQFGRPVDDELLELEWRTTAGTDAVACQVDDPDAWLALLQ